MFTKAGECVTLVTLASISSAILSNFEQRNYRNFIKSQQLWGFLALAVKLTEVLHQHQLKTIHDCLVGCSQLRSAQTSTIWFSQVHCAWQIDSISNSMALPCHFCFGLQQGRLCNSDLSGLKLSVNIANPCSKLLYTEVRQVCQIFRKQTLFV